MVRNVRETAALVVAARARNLSVRLGAVEGKRNAHTAKTVNTFMSINTHLNIFMLMHKKLPKEKGREKEINRSPKVVENLVEKLRGVWVVGLPPLLLPPPLPLLPPPPQLNRETLR